MTNINSRKNKLVLLLTVLVVTIQMAFAHTNKPLSNGDERVAKLKSIAETYFLNDKSAYMQKKSYVVEDLEETNIDYQVSFFHKDHPMGIRGSAAGMSTYTVHIDKITFKVIKRSLGK
jgi:hypothetical protein